MRMASLLFLALLLSIPRSGLAQSGESAVEIGACFRQLDESNDGVANLSNYFIKEMQLKFRDQPLDIELYDDLSVNLESSTRTQNRRQMLSVEITQQGWQVNNAFMIPYIFNIYRNSYKIEAYVRFWRSGSSRPLITKKYNVKSEGAEVVQLVNDDPNDGRLIVSYGRQMLIEKQTRMRLAKQLAGDVYEVIRKGGS